MYDKSVLLEILLQDDYRTLDSDGKPYPPSASVYTIISQKMHERNCNITAKHIYVIVNENRNGYKNLLLQHYNINTDCQIEKNINNTSISEVHPCLPFPHIRKNLTLLYRQISGK